MSSAAILHGALRVSVHKTWRHNKNTEGIAPRKTKIVYLTMVEYINDSDRDLKKKKKKRVHNVAVG